MSFQTPPRQSRAFQTPPRQSRATVRKHYIDNWACDMGPSSHKLLSVSHYISRVGYHDEIGILIPAWIKSLEYSCVFYSGRRMPVCQQIPLSLQNQCSCFFTRPRMPDAGLPDKIIRIFLCLYSGRWMPVFRQIPLSLHNQCSCSFSQDARCRFAR